MSNESMLAKILRWLVYATAFVPLIIFSEYISPFHFGKVVVFRSLIYIMLVLYILLVLKDRSYFPKMTGVGWAFLFFAGAFTLATITSIIPYSSVWGSLERMGGVYTFWHYFIYFIILISVFRTERDWINLFNVMIGVGVLSAFYGFGQRTDLSWIVGSGGRSRIFGTIGNPALFAGYQIVVLFVSATLFLRNNLSMNMRVFYGFSAVIMTIAALMTAVRGSVLGIGVGFLAMALLYTSAYRSKKAKKVLLGLIAGLVLFVGAALMLKNSSFVQSSGYLRRITDFSLTSYTVQTRFWAWEAGFKGWKETPKTVLLGWGPENFNIPFSKYFNPKFFQGPGSETLFDRAHNMFVEILVTMGLLGFATYLWIFGSSLKVLWRKLHEKDHMLYGVGLISLLFAYAIHNSFIFDTSANFIVFFTVLGFISFLATHKTDHGHDKKNVSTKPLVGEGALVFVGIVLSVVAVVGIYFVNILPARANYTTTRAIITGWSGDFAGAVAKYKEAISYDVPGKYEIRHRFAQYVLEGEGKSKEIPGYRDVVLLAIEEVKKNIEENKVDYLPYLYTARLYIILGKDDPKSEYNDKSLELSLAALELAPDFVRTYYEVAQAYLNKKDFDKASEYFKKAVELNPDVGISHWYWGVVEFERGNIALGLSIIESALEKGLYSPSEGELGRLMNVYVQKGDYGRIVWATELAVKRSPASAQLRASLAVAYAKVGKIDDAVLQAHEAARLDSNFEAEAKLFVQSLGRQW